tara:strand:+ start:404 stop:685 length:282 start_codon:yes stop_codon:yes gene_type:complete
MQKMRIIREKSLRNLPKSESNKKNKNDLFNHTINSILLATSTFGLYKFFSNNKVKIEDTSIHELKEKKDTFEKITVINDKTVIIKKKNERRIL